MNLLRGEIVEVYSDGGMTMAKVRISGAYTRVPLMSLPSARVGDQVLVESGVGIALIRF